MARQGLTPYVQDEHIGKMEGGQVRLMVTWAGSHPCSCPKSQVLSWHFHLSLQEHSSLCLTFPSPLVSKSGSCTCHVQSSLIWGPEMFSCGKKQKQKNQKLPAQVPNLPVAQVPQTWRWHRKTSQSFQLETGTAAQPSPQAVPKEVHTSAQYSVVFMLAHLPTKEFVLMYVVGWRQYCGPVLQTSNKWHLCAMAVLVLVDSGN